MFDTFSLFSVLKINKKKWDIVDIGVKNGVKLALCGTLCFYLTEDTINILGIYFSYNKKLEQEKNFLSHTVKIQNILKLWKLRNLTVEGRTAVFKSLTISKISILLWSFKSIINLLNKIQMEFIWKKSEN